MTGQSNIEPMLEMFYFETSQYLEQLEQSIIKCEKSRCFNEVTINEIFRVMHNIKSSAAMMLFNNISALAHTMEDLFFFLREQNTENIDCSLLSDLVLDGVDFIKIELEKIKNGDIADGDNSTLVISIKEVLKALKEHNLFVDSEKPGEHSTLIKQQYYLSKDSKAISYKTNFYKAVVFFQEGCEMENVRAYAIVHNFNEIAQKICYSPEDIIENDNSVSIIREQGFRIFLKTECTYSEIREIFNHTAFIRDLELIQLDCEDDFEEFERTKAASTEEFLVRLPKKYEEGVREDNKNLEKDMQNNTRQSIISVSVEKLDMLMDLVGEMVIAEAMVTQNPDLKGLELNNFKKAARQLRKITGEVQDIVMSIRMVPLNITFQRMQRIVRDMSRKLNKEVVLEIFGEETEVDKNIIEHISDPLMHLVRNAIDHGLESNEERKRKGKSQAGKVVIEAKNAGSDVLIIVKDNGKGLDKEKILIRARENGLLHKPENEMTDREIFNLIFLPGFSTRDNISEYSGRGVGMDVVTKNIETVGGSVLVDSIPDEGTTITLKIPLTLAIIEGMNIKVGKSCYTIPLTTIQESFRPHGNEIITDPDGNEMIMVRGQCFPIVRLHNVFQVETAITQFTEGIIIMVENDEKTICLLADALLGEQQVVVKALPNYIKKVKGLTGCTLLGDGSISLILDIAGFYDLSLSS